MLVKSVDEILRLLEAPPGVFPDELDGLNLAAFREEISGGRNHLGRHPSQAPGGCPVPSRDGFLGGPLDEKAE